MNVRNAKKRVEKNLLKEGLIRGCDYDFTNEFTMGKKLKNAIVARYDKNIFILTKYKKVRGTVKVMRYITHRFLLSGHKMRADVARKEMDDFAMRVSKDKEKTLAMIKERNEKLDNNRVYESSLLI